MIAAEAAPPAEEPPEAAVEDRRLVVTLVVLIGASYALLQLGRFALAGVAALWALALPRLGGRFAEILRRERWGVLFLFLIAAQIDQLDNVFGLRSQIFLGMAALGALWLWPRLADVRAVAREPAALLFALFLVQELLSGWAMDVPHFDAMAVDRLYVLETVVCAAVMVRRPGGRQLLAAAIALGAIMSLPVIGRELFDHERLHLVAAVDNEVRAGGFYGQPNVAGIALDLGLAFAGALWIEGAITGRGFAVLYAAGLAAILGTVSRAAFLVAILVGAGAWLLHPGRRAMTRAFALRAVVVAGAAIFGLGLIGKLLADANDRLEEDGITNVSRLEEVPRALAGKPQDLLDDDSRRLDLIAEAERRIAAKPVFGWGTGAFMEDDLRSHVEWLDILGENGAVGGLFYAAFLIGLGLAFSRLPRGLKLPTILVGGVWLATHFHNHNMLETPFMAVPIGWVLGLSTLSKT